MNDQYLSDHKCEFLKPSQDLECLLLGDLCQLLAVPTALQIPESVLLVIDRLQCALPCRFAIACEGGYMAEVLDRRPNWHRQIEDLFGANLTSIASLDALRDRLERALPFPGVTKEVRSNLSRWMHSLTAIRRREVQLFQEAFSLDTGGEA